VSASFAALEFAVEFAVFITVIYLDDVVPFHSKGGLGVLAFRAEHELFDVNI
jgi:hypothetical protein